jgi:predicted Zn-dependent peptidase
MKYLIGLLLLCTIIVRAEDTSGFWKQLTPEERKAAGLENLTPEQQAALDRAAARFAKEGARQAVETVQAQAKTETAAVVQKVREEAKAEGKAEAKAEAREQRKKDAGLTVRTGDEAIRTRIAGDFRGWDGKTIFKLENGQRWQQVDKEERFFPKQVSPEVEIAPSKMGGWKMMLVKEGLWVRVKRLE